MFIKLLFQELVMVEKLAQKRLMKLAKEEFGRVTMQKK